MNAQQQRLCSLQDKLVSLNARHIAKTTGPDKGPLDWYTVNGQTIIVHVYAHGEGYEVYAPVAGASLSVSETFDALDRIAASNPKPLSVDRQQRPSILDKATEDVAERASAYFRDKRRTMHGPELVALHDAIEVREALLSIALNVSEAKPQPTAADRGATQEHTEP